MRGVSTLRQHAADTPAIGDEGAEEAEDLADTFRYGASGPMGIGLGGGDRFGGGIKHDRNKIIKWG
jgi:hypothetical protein